MNTKKHDVPEELLSGLLANYKKPEDLIGENGLLKQLTKLLVERALDAELTEHLGHERNEAVANPAGNTRNGKSKKTLKGEFGELPIEVPRERHGSFEPQLIPKHQTRWAGFDDKIISLYARGMTVREIQAHLEEMYGTEVSPSLISSVTATGACRTSSLPVSMGSRASRTPSRRCSPRRWYNCASFTWCATA